MCDWCYSLRKRYKDFQLGDMVALTGIGYTYWGDGQEYIKYAIYCPFCGEEIQYNKEQKID